MAPLTRAQVLAWARAHTTRAGEYLIVYAHSGLTSEQDPGSRCGFSDDELEEIAAVLRARDLRLVTDDIGLLAAAPRER